MHLTSSGCLYGVPAIKNVSSTAYSGRGGSSQLVPEPSFKFDDFGNMTRIYEYFISPINSFKQIHFKQINPFSTEPLASFLLLESDNLGIFHQNSLKIE